MKKITLIALCFILLSPILLFISRANAENVNLIVNPSVENSSNNQPLDFSPNSWGNNTSTFSYTAGHTGAHGLSVSVSNYANGDAKWVADRSAVSAGQMYMYSDYNLSDVESELDAEYVDAAGNSTYVYLQTINASATWQQSSVTFTAPADAVSVSILHVIYSNGTLRTDDYSLTPTTSTPPATNPTVPSSTNLITNSSFENSDGVTPTGWNKGGYGTNTRTLSYATGDAHTGNYSATVSLPTTTDGDVKWYASPVAVDAGSSYTYSDYYKSTVDTSVVAMMLEADGNDSYVDLSIAPAANDWTQYSNSFTIPVNIKSITIFHLLNKVGSLSIDDVSLTKDTITVPVEPTDPSTPTSNLVANSSFEMANSDGSPAGWIQDNWGDNTTDFSYVTDDAHTGASSAKVTVSNYVDGDAKWYFTPLTSLTPGAEYSYSTWYKTNTKISAVAMYTDASGVRGYINLPAPLVNIDSASTWQSYGSTFQVPLNATSMSVFFVIHGNGWLQTDDVSVIPYTVKGFNEPIVSLTFDDGWTSVYDNAFPLLQKYGFVSTQYIISSYLGQPYYMTEAQVKAFQNAGSEIGSHTVTHPDLTTLSAPDLMTELTQSKATLQADFGSTAALNIASPYGAYNATVLSAIQQSYQAHRSVDVGYNSKDNFNSYNILVQNITTDTTVADVVSWVAQAKATNTWLVIVYHSVTADGVFDADTVSTANLDAELQAIKDSGISVKTMTQALAEVKSQL